MSEPWIECIPNFSEGRRLEVVEALRQAIASCPGVVVLDVHSDADHNRSVITFAGPASQVGQAAFEAIRLASSLIDLETQRGEHPRIGATDVVPFVPLAGADLQQCVELARRLGRRVGEELNLPVYLYEAAATRPDRVNLEDLRRGEYEGLRRAIVEDPERAPDFGPSRLGPAGATVIGARPPLIAFNVYLTTPEVAVARAIARAVRHSSGGLRHVKALGLLVEGRAQVSMNLTDFTRTPLARVVEMIRREAARHGVGLLRCELVGLIPQRALVDAAVWYLQLDDFEPAQLLEAKIEQARQDPADDDPGLLRSLASAAPTPGGGSAAAMAGAMAASLAAMVARLTIGKKKFSEVEGRMQALADRADTLRGRLAEAIREDAAAFDAVLAAMRMPRETEADRTVRAEAIERATLGALQVPLEVARSAAEAADLAALAAEIGNPNAISDAGSGIALARAALTGADLNVRINARELGDAAGSWEDVLAEAGRRVADAETRFRAALSSRAGIPI